MGSILHLSQRRIALLAGPIVCLALAALLLAPAARADGVPFNVGDVFAGAGNGMIKHFDKNGTLLDTLNTTSGASEDTGMCFDQAGNLYTTNFAASTMSKFDVNGNLVAASFGSGFNSHPESCVFDSSGHMFVGQADGSKQVLEFDTSGNLLASFSPTPDNRGTDFIDLAADQHTLHYTSEGALVKQFDVSTSTQLPDFASGMPAPCYAHRILAGGGELVACRTEVVRLDATGAIVQTYPVDPTTNLFALNVDPDGTSFWTADFNGMIYHVDIASGTVLGTINATPFVDVAGLAVFGEQTVASDATIAATGAATLSGTEGKSLSGTVATITDPDTSANAAEYSASISWGDGSTSTGTVSGSGGSFTVAGSHTYAEEGSHPIMVTLTDVDNTSNTATATTSAKVADAPLAALGISPQNNSSANVNGTVATFTDQDPGGTLSDYTASINWGDGATTTGTITVGSGKFNVGGSHVYSKSGTYKITTTIKDAGGSTATATSSVTVSISVTPPPPGRAKLGGIPPACVLAPFTVNVHGKRISRVTFLLDGKKVDGKTVHRGKLYTAVITLSAGNHSLTVKVKFRASTHTPSRTFHRTVSGCKPVIPVFTG